MTAIICVDTELRAILEYNRDEEKEHAAMVLEWIRRKDPKMDNDGGLCWRIMDVWFGRCQAIQITQDYAHELS